MQTATRSDSTLLHRFQAMAEETRFEIVRMLSGGERCVCELQGDLDAAQSRLSFHLRKLKDAGIVSDRREGRWVYYALVPGALEEMRAFLGEVRPSGNTSPQGSRALRLPVREVASEGSCCG